MRTTSAAALVAALATGALAGSGEVKLTASDAAAGDLLGQAVAVDGDVAVTGAPGDDGGRGAAYVYVRCGGAWTLQAKLTASDAAAGDRLGSSVALSGDTAVVGASLDDDGGASSGSAYVFQRDAAGEWTQTAKLTASDAAPDDEFGYSVAVSGDTAVVGAPLNDDGGSASGSAYVFTRDAAGTWSERQKLTASDAAAGDELGWSVAVSGDAAVVGAYRDDDGGSASGSAYVFTRDAAGTWSQRQKLTASDAAAGDLFGYSVVVSGDTAIVGAPANDDGGTDSGSAYVFTRDAVGTWSAPRKLTASDAAAGGSFGWSVAVSADAAVVGAKGDDDGGTGSGSAYVFRRDAAGVWNKAAKLTASDAANFQEFGWSVAVSGDTAVVGAYSDDDGATDSGAVYVYVIDRKLQASDAAAGDAFGYSVAVSGDTAVVGARFDGDGGASSGSAYVFRRDAAGAWTQTAKLTASDAAAGDQFGYSVALSGDTAVVGALFNDDGGTSSGSAYVFTRDAAGTWNERQKLTASDAAAGDEFGTSVSVSGDTAVVGANKDDDGGTESGSAYVFRRDAAGAWTQTAKLTASDAAAGDQFGISVAVSGDTAVVGADLDDGGGSDSGSAYVFRRDAIGAWTPSAKLTASDAAAGDAFGTSVSISGDTAVVGASDDDDGGLTSGSACVFRRDVFGAWEQTVKLKASDAVAGDNFGFSVAVSGDTAVVGAVGDDDAGVGSGAAYAFRRNAGGAWSQAAKLTASDAAAADRMGWSVAVSGDTAVVGAESDDDGVKTNSGSAYVFAPVGAGVPLEILTASVPDATLGAAYHATIAVQGGARPRRFEVSYGTLPSPLVLDPETGAIDGVCELLGTYTFLVRVTDACGEESTQPYAITVDRAEAPPQIESVEMPVPVLDRPYSATPVVTGGTPPLTWSVAEGDLPDGISLDADTGELSGRPSAAGPSSFRVRCVDATGAADERLVTFDVAPVADLAKGKLAAEIPVNLLNGVAPIVRALELVAGTRLDVGVKYRASDEAPVTLDVVDAAGASVTADAKRRHSASGLQIQGIAIPATGRYFVQATPVAPYEGLLRLSVKATAPKSAGATVSIADGETLDVEVGTLAGARVTIAVKAAPGSAASPTISSVKDDTGAELLVASELKSSSTSAVLTMKTPVPGGTLTVTLGTAAGTGGDVVWSARIRQPKSYVHSEPDLAAGVVK